MIFIPTELHPSAETETVAPAASPGHTAIIGNWRHGGSYGDGVIFEFRSDGTFAEAGIFKLYITGKTNMIIIDGSYTVIWNSIRCFNQKMRHQLWKCTTVLLEERQLDVPPDETYLWRIEAAPYGGAPFLYMQAEGKEEVTRYSLMKELILISVISTFNRHGQRNQTPLKTGRRREKTGRLLRPGGRQRKRIHAAAALLYAVAEHLANLYDADNYFFRVKAMLNKLKLLRYNYVFVLMDKENDPVGEEEMEDFLQQFNLIVGDGRFVVSFDVAVILDS